MKKPTDLEILNSKAVVLSGYILGVLSGSLSFTIRVKMRDTVRASNFYCTYISFLNIVFFAGLTNNFLHV